MKNTFKVLSLKQPLKDFFFPKLHKLLKLLSDSFLFTLPLFEPLIV